MNERKSLFDAIIEMLKSANKRELDLILKFAKALLALAGTKPSFGYIEFGAN